MDWMKGVDKKLNNCWKIIDRKNFVPDPNIDSWKINKPIIIGKGQTTSQPTLISEMLKHMDINEIIKKKKHNPNYKIRVLDIGSGSGIVSALIACLIGKGNYVLGIDLYKKLVKDSRNNVKKIKKQNVENFENFAKIKFKQMNAYDLFNRKIKENEKYDLIYVGAEPKKEEDIVKFKEGVPKLLKKDGIALGPIEGQIQKFKNEKNGYWEIINISVSFVPLEDKKLKKGGRKTLKKPKTIKKRGKNKTYKNIKKINNNIKKINKNIEKINNNIEKKQKKLIKEEHFSRTSLKCDKTDKLCDIVAITGRSANLYKNHLFPDFNSMSSLKKWSKNKCVIDVGSGINTIYEKSFLAMLSKNKLGKDLLGVDISKINKTHKRFSRFIKGNIKTLKYNRLKLNKKCKKTIVLINNLLYLWIDNPIELKKAYKNLFSWLKSGSQIRVFPVYFGRYDMYNDDLKKFIDDNCKVKILNPKITAEEMYEWDTKNKNKVYLKSPLLKDEKNINKKLGAKTLVLTIK